MQERNEYDQIVGPKISNWQPSKWPEKSALEGRFGSLEPLNIEKHAEALFEAFQRDNSGSSWTYLPYGPFADFHAFNDFLKSVLGDDPLFYAIIDARTKLPVGLTSFLRITPVHGVIEIGQLHFSSYLKKRSLATEGIYLMMRTAFDELSYRRLEWKCDALNEPSRKAALRLGFTFEGIFRQDKIVKERSRDTAWFSIIDSEWPKIKNRLEKWLQPNNFDANDVQIKRLSDMN